MCRSCASASLLTARDFIGLVRMCVCCMTPWEQCVATGLLFAVVIRPGWGWTHPIVPFPLMSGHELCVVVVVWLCPVVCLGHVVVVSELLPLCTTVAVMYIMPSVVALFCVPATCVSTERCVHNVMHSSALWGKSYMHVVRFCTLRPSPLGLP